MKKLILTPVFIGFCIALFTENNLFAQTNLSNITISTGTQTSGLTLGDPTTYSGAALGASDLVINASTLATALMNGNVSISTTNTGANGTGNVTFSNPVTSAKVGTTAYTFSLTAGGYIAVNAAINLTPSASGGSNGTTRPGNHLSFSASNNITISNNITTTGNKRGGADAGAGGNITLISSNGSVSIGGILTSSGGSTTTNVYNGGNGGHVEITTTSGSILVNTEIMAQGGAGDNGAGGTDGNGGNISLSAGSGITLTANLSNTATSGVAPIAGIAGNFFINNEATIVTSGGTNDGQTTGIISGGNLTKTGNGRLFMSGTNIYSGTTTISAGSLCASGTIAASTAGPFGNSATAILLNGGTVESNTTTFSRAISLTATNSGIDAYGSARTISSNINNTTGDYNLNIGGTTVTNAQGQNLTLSGTISSNGTLTLTKIGNSTLTLSGNNTYSNGFTLNGGTVNIGNSTALGNSGSLTIAGGTINNTSGSALTISNSGINVNGDFTFTGTHNLNLGTGAISLNSNIQIITDASTLTLGGVINQNTYTIIKSGNGILSFGNQAITINGLTIQAGELISTSGQLSIAGTFTNSGTFTPNGGTVNFNAAGNQTIPSLAFYHLTCSGSGIKSLTGNTTVNGALTLSSAKLNIGSNTLTLNGDFNGSSTGCLIGGSTSNLTISGSGALTTSLFFENNGAATDSTLQNFILNRSGQTITLGNKLMLLGTLTPTAGTLISGGNLIIASNSTATATVWSGSGTITGSVKVQRFVPSGERRWRFLASQVNSTTLSDWQGEIHITGTLGAVNGFDPTSSNQPSVYTYNETQISGDLNYGWEPATHIDNPVASAKGYRVFIRGTREAGRLNGTITTQDEVTLDVNGTLTSGNVTMNPTFTSSDVLSNDGWNLLGNPYASAIDWDQFHDAGRSGADPDYTGTDYAHLDPTVYIYNAASNAYVSYNALSSGSLTNGIIPSGTAFWVKAVAASPSMTLRESYKTSLVPIGVHKTGPGTDFTLRLVRNENNYDDLIIKYIDEAQPALDAFDIKKMFGPDVNLASGIGMNTHMALDARPNRSSGDTIQLCSWMKADGDYTFEFYNIDSFAPGQEVHFIDLLLKQQINVRSDKKYAFHFDLFDPNQYGIERFLLIIGDRIPGTGIWEKQVNPAPSIFAYPQVTSGSLIIMGLQPKQAEIEIRDMHGRLLREFTKTGNNDQMEIDLSGYPAGAYLIWVQQGLFEQPVVLKCFKQD
ncbi:MAG: autotransporter-associated beta strand repeat-containing protein [Bacteroidia bacterium]|jgi:autotransporter-associated beta strand protein